MAVTFTSFKDRFPLLSQTPESEFNAVLSSAQKELNPKTWGPTYITGLLLLTAHLLEINKRNGIPGAIVSDKVSKLDRKFQSNSPIKSSFERVLPFNNVDLC